MKKRFLDVLKNADSFFVYNKGEKVKADRVEFLREFLKMAENCYYMPCIGVAKDDVIKKALKDGYWVEFCFDKIAEYADQSFTSLLMHIRPKFNGFNVVRGIDGVYEGKTFYLSLAIDSTEFFNHLKEKY